MSDFRKDLEYLINGHSFENVSNTPDWVLADFLTDCLKAFDKATNARVQFHHRGKEQNSDCWKPGNGPDAHCLTMPNGECISKDPRCMHHDRSPVPHCVACKKVLEDCGCDGFKGSELR